MSNTNESWMGARPTRTLDEFIEAHREYTKQLAGQYPIFDPANGVLVLDEEFLKRKFEKYEAHEC